ncbi:Nmad5 family putative nucleotide modification protein [Sedimenticola hydrogenitrophicus]|uniref:Nmad5 family putative nucleotide modification protein n=1 Tax=Sedimenticola hydrogenitrophicus TaxID=2967975 RepID=UPI0023AEC4A2|nr:Nmad5 family putative nucleotide modification protein [Sedimenticola hydrogenitrophicus]
MRLNKQIKTKIIEAAVEGAIKKRIAQLKDMESALADAIYSDQFGRHAEYMGKAPEGFFVAKRSFQLYIRAADKGRSPIPYDNDERPYRCDSSVTMTATRRMPYTSLQGIYLDHDHPLAIEARAIMDKHKRLWTGKKELQQQIAAMVNSHYTTERLLETWPEAAPYIPKPPVTENRLPAVTADQINHRIACVAAGNC